MYEICIFQQDKARATSTSVFFMGDTHKNPGSHLTQY